MQPKYMHRKEPWPDKEEFVPEKGVQPLDALMEKLKISNQELVKASSEQLTFKVVGKARKGRKLNEKMQNKILNALQAVRPKMEFTLQDLFNY